MARPAPKSLLSTTVAYVVAVCLAIVAFEAWREWSAHDAALAKAQHEAQNLARSIRQHAEDTYEIAAQAVGMVAYELTTDAVENGDFGEAETFMLHLMEGSPRLASLSIYDADGRWVATTLPEGSPNDIVDTGKLVERHGTDPSLEVAFGTPVPSADGAATFTTVSQRVDHPTGRFAGIVVASISSDYFDAVHSKVEVGTAGGIALFDQSGRMVTGQRNSLPPVAAPSAALFGTSYPGVIAGHYEFTSGRDGITRVAGYDSSSRYPVTAVVAVSRDEALHEWWRGAVLRGLATLGLALVVAVLGLRLADQMRRRQQVVAVLAQKEGEFRLLAETASDLVERFTSDGTRTYISPALERLTGYRPDELLGTSAFEIVHEDDRPAVEAAAHRLRTGASEQETVVFRRLHRDGREIWLETSLRVAADQSGEFSVVGVTRDITDRKQLEQRLEIMAMRDGLTELANRRAFDAALARETGRARRSNSPLSLLMIDADRFKRFNDDHGHLAGDACLKAIASVTALAARRPSDLAARFGGEEMVVLLPDTDIDAAYAIAQDLCRQVQALSIPHARNLPWKVATVSIGVASIDPGNDEAVHDGTWLVTTADRALYDAKAQGRNQSVSATRRLRSKLAV